jgi:hypothetical protein
MSTDGLWTTFGADAVTLTATITVDGTVFTVVRTMDPNAWYALTEQGREFARQEMRLLLADKLVKSVGDVRVELPSI